MRGVVLLVFLFPAVISIFFGGAVLAQVLQQPDRELNMMPFDFSKGPSISTSKAISIIGLKSQYDASSPVKVTVSITDPFFDCGDLYITIYDLSKIPKEVAAQNGFFEQCYAKNNLIMPIDEEFSETVSDSGQYEIVAEINDKDYKKTLTASERFTVR